MISLQIDWFDLLVVQGTCRSFLQHHSSKASILRHFAFFMIQFSQVYMTTGKTTALTMWTFFGRVMSLLFYTLSRFVITFLPRRNHLLISQLQSPHVVMTFMCVYACILYENAILYIILSVSHMMHGTPRYLNGLLQRPSCMSPLKAPVYSRF